MKTILLWGLAMALCACTSEQYAQFSKRVNDSISRTLGTQTEPPTSPDWKSETAIDYVAAPVPPAAPKAAPAPKPKLEHPTAKGIDLVGGAIVCPSMNLASWLFGEINSARHARQALSPEQRQNAALVNGYDIGIEPKPSDYRCEFVPAGTPMNVRMQDGYIPVVWGTLKDGRPFAGVTIPTMIDR